MAEKVNDFSVFTWQSCSIAVAVISVFSGEYVGIVLFETQEDMLELIFNYTVLSKGKKRHVEIILHYMVLEPHS